MENTTQTLENTNIIDVDFKNKTHKIRQQKITTSNSYKWDCNTCGAKHVHITGEKNVPHISLGLLGKDINNETVQGQSIRVCGDCLKEIGSVV